MKKTAFLASFLLLLALVLTGCKSTPAPATPTQNRVEASRLNVELGLGYLSQGNMVRAKQKLLLAVQQNTSLQSYGALAYFYEQTGDIAQASTYYQKAIDTEPHAGAGHNNYGAFLCRQKDYTGAQKQFALAVADPTYLNTASAYENAGVCALQIPDITQAQTDFQKAVQHDPKMANSWLQLSKIALTQQQYSQAQTYLTQYWQQAPITASTLALGIQIAQAQHNAVQVTQYVQQLQQKFPASSEYQQYRNYQ